uniref:Gamma-retroviral matrix protein domain-containing protein n=1 Tax=Rousettus aegyptiacus TaxID=9407 RepID=A0A7J8C2D6_ROUAE|nr:hypothetical protein HJG63_009347 [Rousettus aegyptiacus]
MGEDSFKPTVLNCMLKNFKKGFPGDNGVKLTPGKLCTLCELEWLAFRVGWPSEGTLDLLTVRAVYWVVTGTPGHLDKFPYVDSWLQITTVVPSWTWFLCKYAATELGTCDLTNLGKGQERASKSHLPRGP